MCIYTKPYVCAHMWELIVNEEGRHESGLKLDYKFKTKGEAP